MYLSHQIINYSSILIRPLIFSSVTPVRSKKKTLVLRVGIIVVLTLQSYYSSNFITLPSLTLSKVINLVLESIILVFPILVFQNLGSILGELIDVGRGQAVGQILNPHLNKFESIVGEIFDSLLNTVFFVNITFPFLFVLNSFKLLAFVGDGDFTAKFLCKIVEYWSSLFWFITPCYLIFIFSDIIFIVITTLITKASYLQEMIVLRSVFIFLIGLQLVNLVSMKNFVNFSNEMFKHFINP